MKYELKALDIDQNTGRTLSTVTFEFEDVFLGDVLNKVNDFLLATGFRMKGYVGIVSEEDKDYV